MLRPSPRHLRVSAHGSPWIRRYSRLRVLGALGLILLFGAVGLPLKRANALPQGQAVWSVKCEVSHRAPDDPIVFPAQAGRSHMHDFFGNVSTDADSSTASLVRAASSCLKGMDAVDRAAYWTPSLLQGNAVVAGVPGEQRIDAYYAVLDKRTPVRPIPFGLRMVAGDAKATSPQPLDIVHYNCLRYPNGGQVTKPSASIPTCPGGSYLSAKISFPGCWDGKNLDSADHKSHMAYPVRGACPVSHPVGLPSVGIRVRWKTVRGVPSSQLSLSSGGQLSMHADFWNVWNPAAMDWLVTHCLNQTQNCTDVARTQIAATGAFPSGDSRFSTFSGITGGASTATRPTSTPTTARPRGQGAAANDSVAANGGATPQPGNDNDGDLLAVTGPSDTRLPLGAGLLLAVGIAIVAVARYRPRHVRR
jgi:hypothetical protein